MTVNVSNLTANSDADGNNVATTAIVSPADNNLLLLTVDSRTNLGVPADPVQPTVAGLSLTWTAVNTIVYDTTSGSRRRKTVFRAMGLGIVPGTIVITFGIQNQTDVVWILDQFSGVDTGGTGGSAAVVQSTVNKDEVGAATSLTVTLAAFANTANATYGSFGNTVTGSSRTAGSGFTLVSGGDIASGTNIRATTEFRDTNDTSVDFTWGASGDQFGGVAIEIAAAAVVAAPGSTLMTMGIG